MRNKYKTILQCSVSISHCVYKNIYSYVFISLPFSSKSFKPNCFLHKKNSHMFQDTQDLSLMWPGMLCLLCLPQTGCIWLCFHIAHTTQSMIPQFVIHTIYVMIEISLCNWKDFEDTVVLYYTGWKTLRRDIHAKWNKYICLPMPGNAFISLVGHWITLPIINSCTSWIFSAPFSPNAAVVFHSLIRIQNATSCVHQRENRAEKTVQ